MLVQSSQENVDYPGKAEYKLALGKTNILHLDNNSSVNSLLPRKSRIGELACGEVNILPRQKTLPERADYPHKEEYKLARGKINILPTDNNSSEKS